MMVRDHQSQWNTHATHTTWGPWSTHARGDSGHGNESGRRSQPHSLTHIALHPPLPCDTESNVKQSSFAIHLSHMSARETSAPVKVALETLSHRIDGVESERLRVLAQLQALIVNKFDKYPGELQVQKSSIETRNKAVVSETGEGREGDGNGGTRIRLPVALCYRNK